ncbi:MAG: hypothetical protein P8075_01595 [Deltaproteobacteria bacterium]
MLDKNWGKWGVPSVINPYNTKRKQMRKVLLRPQIVWLVFLFLILQPSCGHREPLPPSAEIRKNLGTIGVASGCFKPECSSQKRTSELASGALKGAFEAEGKMYDTTTPGTGDSGQICCLVLTPFTMCGGALSGAARMEHTTPSPSLDMRQLRRTR